MNLWVRSSNNNQYLASLFQTPKMLNVPFCTSPLFRFEMPSYILILVRINIVKKLSRINWDNKKISGSEPGKYSQIKLRKEKEISKTSIARKTNEKSANVCVYVEEFRCEV